MPCDSELGIRTSETLYSHTHSEVQYWQLKFDLLIIINGGLEIFSAKMGGSLSEVYILAAFINLRAYFVKSLELQILCLVEERLKSLCLFYYIKELAMIFHFLEFKIWPKAMHAFTSIDSQ